MTTTVTCPGCGAPLQVADNARSLTCTFCGNTFAVNTETTTPELKRPDPDAPLTDIPGAPVPDMGPQDPNVLYNPPLTGEVVNPPYIPVTNNTSGYAGNSNYSNTDDPQPDFYKTVFDQGKNTVLEKGRLLGNRLWLIIAIIVTTLLCSGCLCIFLISLAFRR